MSRESEATRRWLARLRRIAFAVAPACAVAVGSPCIAQTLVLPSLDVSAEADSRRVVLTWQEAPQADGRAVSNLNTASLGDSASDVTVIGQYVLDCDYRLRLTKIPKDAGFNRHVQLIYEITENTSGIGLALRSDTLDVFEPNVTYMFDPAIAGNLGVRFTPTANQPDSLGGIDLTVAGLSTSLSETQNYFATSLNTVAVLADTLLVEVTGPVPTPIPDPLPPGTQTDTLMVTAADIPLAIQNGMTLSFSEGSAAPGDTARWTSRYLFEPAGLIRADLEAFEGYHVWRSDLPSVDDFTLLGEVRQCTSKRDFVLVNDDELLEIDVSLDFDAATRTFTFTDRDIHDDFPYRYAISTFDRGFLGNPEDLTFEGTLDVTEKMYPASPLRDSSQKAYVVPNPYNERSQFQETGRRVVFANLPLSCTIRIFTVAADFVTTLYHGPGESGSTSASSREWNLRSDVGAVVAAGIYVYYIDGTDTTVRALPGGGSEVVTAPFQQYGKMMIAR